MYNPVMYATQIQASNIQEDQQEQQDVRVDSMDSNEELSASSASSNSVQTLAASILNSTVAQNPNQTNQILKQKLLQENSQSSSSLLSSSPEHSPNQISDSEHSVDELSTTSMDSQVNVVELNGEKYIKLTTYTNSVKIQASCEKAYQQLSLVQAALGKTSAYINQRQLEINKVIEDFCQEMGYKPNGFAIIQGQLNAQQQQDTQQLKRSRDQSESESSPVKRVKEQLEHSNNRPTAAQKLVAANNAQGQEPSNSPSNPSAVPSTLVQPVTPITTSQSCPPSQSISGTPTMTPPTQHPTPPAQQPNPRQTNPSVQTNPATPDQQTAKAIQQQYLSALAARQAQQLQQQAAQQTAIHTPFAQQQRHAQAQAAAAQQLQYYNQLSSTRAAYDPVAPAPVQQAAAFVNNINSNVNNINSEATKQMTRHWNDAMYNLLSRAQNLQPNNPPSVALQAAAVQAVQARVQQQKIIKKEVAEVVPKNQSKSQSKNSAQNQKSLPKDVKSEKTEEKKDENRSASHTSDSGNDTNESDHGTNGTATATAATASTSTAKTPNQQVKPQWIIKRMEKLKSLKKGQPTPSTSEPAEEETEYVPLDAELRPELVEVDDEDIDADIEIEDDSTTTSAAAMLSAAQKTKANQALATIQEHQTAPKPLRDPKSYTISCKQCRWTLRKWETWARKRNNGELKYLESQPTETSPTDFLTLTTTKDLVYWMSKFIREIRKDNSEAYQIDSITAFAFSLQKVLKETGRQVDILRNEKFVPFLEAMNEAMDLSVKTVVLNPTPRLEEDQLWRNGELGYHTPEALTQTISLIIVKHLKIRSSQAHRDLEITDFEKGRMYNPANPTQLIECYRYKEYRGGANRRAEILPNFTNPERCPVRILDYYLEKRPPAIRHTGPFYLWPADQTKAPAPFCWYRVKPLSKKYLLKCLFKIKQTNLNEV